MLKELIKYTEVADKIVLDILISTPVSEKATALFSHVLNAQHVWASRILGTSIQYGVQQLHQSKDFPLISKQNISLLNEIISGTDLEQNVVYQNFAGEQFENKVGDILFHVINHSTYHRAQITTEIRNAGLTPPVTDFILLKREGLL